MIRILHVIDKLSMDGVNPSSCTRLFVDWHRHHDPERFAIAVASLRAKDPAGEYLSGHGVPVYYLTKGKFSLANVTAITALTRQLGAQLLHLHGYSSANFGRLAARKLGLPSVMHEHAILRVLPHQYLADRLLRSKTDVAVAVSQAVAEFLHQGRSVPRDKIRVIWNGVNLEHFRRPEPAHVEAFRARFVQPGEKLVGTITRLREEKGNRYFIAAAAEVLRQEPRARFVLVGDGPERGQLERQVADLGLAGRVHFAGFVREVAAALAAFDIAVIPSLREGFGLALAEAMAAGRPVVASRVGGMVEMAQHEQHALMVPGADAMALAAAMQRLLQDAALAGRLAEAARMQSEKFGIARNVRELETLYAELHAAGSNGAAGYQRLASSLPQARTAAPAEHH